MVESLRFLSLPRDQRCLLSRRLWMVGSLHFLQRDQTPLSRLRRRPRYSFSSYIYSKVHLIHAIIVIQAPTRPVVDGGIIEFLPLGASRSELSVMTDVSAAASTPSDHLADRPSAREATVADGHDSIARSLQGVDKLNRCLSDDPQSVARRARRQRKSLKIQAQKGGEVLRKNVAGTLASLDLDPSVRAELSKASASFGTTPPKPDWRLDPAKALLVQNFRSLGRRHPRRQRDILDIHNAMMKEGYAHGINSMELRSMRAALGVDDCYVRKADERQKKKKENLDVASLQKQINALENVNESAAISHVMFTSNRKKIYALRRELKQKEGEEEKKKRPDVRLAELIVDAIVQFAENNSFQRSGASTDTRIMPRTKAELYRIFFAEWPETLRHLARLHRNNSDLIHDGNGSTKPTHLHRGVQAALESAKVSGFNSEAEKEARYSQSRAQHERHLHITALVRQGTLRSDAIRIVDTMPKR